MEGDFMTPGWQPNDISYYQTRWMIPGWQPSHTSHYRIGFSSSTSTLNCHWCGIDLSTATKLTYLNGNLPCCDLCLCRAQHGKKD
jgi:hypothetical protein